MEKFYVTTPIYYVNDSPHVGHSYTLLACDVIARFKRLDGYKVHFLTGTDEHGQKVEKAAKKAELTPETFTDKVSVRFRELSDIMNFSNDDFIRTSEPRHIKFVQKMWNKLLDSGNIYLGKYSGWYSVRDEAYYNEADLIDGKAPNGSEVEWVEEPSYFFRLSNWTEKLLQYYKDNPKFIAPDFRLNEVISFVSSGLHDLSVSRTSFKWGIPVPGDEAHVIYVWLDALFNYCSAVDQDDLKDFWPANLHVVGKDILRFHAVYWPAFLMAINYPLPKQVFAHGWWLVEGEKMSKSVGNVVSPLEITQKYGLDYTRYFLMREIPFGNDGNFTTENLINRVNSELCNNLGNLSQRVLSFINKHCEGRIPNYTISDPKDDELLNKAYTTLEKMRVHLDNLAIHLAFEEVIKLSSSANEYIDFMAPWNLKKTNVERMNSVLYVLAECIRVISILMQPLIPQYAGKMMDNLGLTKRDFAAISKAYALKSGEILPEPQIIFPKLEVVLKG